MRARHAALAALLAIAGPLAVAAQSPVTQPAIESLDEPIRVRVTCSIQAATRFALPANLVIAVAEQEGGRVGQWVQNKNGSYDVGPLQFNTAYLTSLESFGITPKDVAADGCYPYELAAWRLRRHLDRDAGDLWTRAANYHSKTPAHNARYRTAIRARAAKWAQWLSEHVPSIEIAPLEAPPSPNPPPVPPAHLQTKHVVEATRIKRRSPRSDRRPAPAHSNASPLSASSEDGLPRPHVTETLAALDAQRHTQLLEFVSHLPRANTRCTSEPCRAEPHVRARLTQTTVPARRGRATNIATAEQASQISSD